MKGFTLLEVMIALAIMAGVVVTVLTAFNHHLSVVSRDREETVAVLLARAKLDEPGAADLAGKKGTFAPQWPEIAWEATATPIEIPGIQRLTLTVSWDGARRQLALVQYLQK